jgi:2-polyprenyl-6-methoxyphenol hydroxylase-like FAD-dependent oxidoreductase
MIRHHQVLIVGAGPCGLMTACELRRRGVAADIVDAAPQPQRGSRAILLWPPSLRLYRDLGILPEAERRGVTIQALSYYLGPGRTLRLPLSPAMAPLILPQEDTDDLLDGALRRLGGSVEWGATLTKLDRGRDDVRVELRHSDGSPASSPADSPADSPASSPEPRRADWLIGADGFRSTTRELLGVAFAGARLPTTFLLAEGRITGDYDPAAVHYFLGRAGVLLIAPLPGGRVRLSAPLPDGATVGDDTAQRMLDERGPGGLRVADLTLNTSFTSHERIAAQMRVGRCFLVGDAAHTHSVVGGQGLNLGLGDARNLAWKLSGVIDGRLDPRVLDSYDVERRAAAEQVVRATGRMARQAVLGPFSAWMRNTLFSAAHRAGVLGRKLPPLLAGWDIRYPDALFAPGPGRRAGFLPPPGAHSPEWTPGGIERAGPDSFELVTLGPDDPAQRAQAAALTRQHGALVSHRHVVAGKQGFLLLRPDGFVAASGRSADLGWLADALATLAGSNKELRK